MAAKLARGLLTFSKGLPALQRDRIYTFSKGNALPKGRTESLFPFWHRGKFKCTLRTPTGTASAKALGRAPRCRGRGGGESRARVEKRTRPAAVEKKPLLPPVKGAGGNHVTPSVGRAWGAGAG